METETLSRIGQLNNTAKKSTENVLLSTLRTTIEMLQDRGYNSIQACQSIDEIVENMTENRCIVCGNGRRTIQVFFHNEDRVGVKQLRSWVETTQADGVIIVSLEGPTAFTRREAEQNYPHVQFFSFRELCVNITKHVLVPKHEKVSIDDLPFELSKNCYEVPSLYSTDRVAQYYAFQTGDIIRITRTAGVQEPVFYYRILRQPPAS